MLGWKRILKNCILMHQKTVTCNFKNDESNKEKIVNASGVSWHQSWTKKNQFQLTNWLNLQLSSLPAKKIALHCRVIKVKLEWFFTHHLSSDHHIFSFFEKEVVWMKRFTDFSFCVLNCYWLSCYDSSKGMGRPVWRLISGKLTLRDVLYYGNSSI